MSSPLLFDTSRFLCFYTYAGVCVEKLSTLRHFKAQKVVMLTEPDLSLRFGGIIMQHRSVQLQEHSQLQHGFRNHHHRVGE